MNTKKIKTSKYLAIAVASIIGGFISVNAEASDKSSQAGDAVVIYQSQTANPSIYSYSNSILGEISVKPELIYVSQAYGPAIYSYAHSGSEKIASWNVEYVDTAFGRAIYSYNNHQPKAMVEILPVTQ